MIEHKTSFLLLLANWSKDHSNRCKTSYMAQNNSVARGLASLQKTIKEATFIGVCMCEV